MDLAVEHLTENEEEIESYMGTREREFLLSNQ